MSTLTATPIGLDRDLKESKTQFEDVELVKDDRLYELVDGELVEKQMSDIAHTVAFHLDDEIKAWARPTKAGQSHVETPFQCFPNRPGVVRRPDVAFISATRLAGYQLGNPHFRLVPELAVEVVSPNDIWYDVNTKIGEYHAAGVALVWLLSPDIRQVQVHPNGGKPRLLTADDDLDGGDVLPGFSVRVGDLFPDLPPADAGA